jgi:hypothetical protein
MVPEPQTGVCPGVDCGGVALACVDVCVRELPWQLIFEQVFVVLLKAGAPDFAL